MSEFRDKVVLVTGAGRGHGKKIAHAFSIQGAIIAGNDLTPVNLDDTINRITAGGGRARAYIFDIAKKFPVQTLVTQVIDDWGRIDVLVNCASVRPRAKLLEMDDWDWQRTLDVNLSAPFYTMQSVGRIMKEQGGGAIINIAALSEGDHHPRNQSAYFASKIGLIGLTKLAAQELLDLNIRVNLIHQGMVTMGLAAQDEISIPQWQLGRPTDVVELALFLCSQEASKITGQTVDVGGGSIIAAQMG